MKMNERREITVEVPNEGVNLQKWKYPEGNDKVETVLKSFLFYYFANGLKTFNNKDHFILFSNAKIMTICNSNIFMFYMFAQTLRESKFFLSETCSIFKEGKGSHRTALDSPCLLIFA